MLYRLILNDKDNYEKLIDNGILTLKFKNNIKNLNQFYKNEIKSDEIRESLEFMSAISKIENGDYIWIISYEQMAIAKVVAEGDLDRENLKVEIPVEVYEYNFETVFERSENKILDKILDSDILIESINIFNFLSDDNSMQTLKDDNSKLISKSKEIEYTKKFELAKIPKKEIKIKTEPSTNFGEMIIEVHPPKDQDKIEEKQEKANELAKNDELMDFYMELFNNQMEFYNQLQKMTMDNFMKMQQMFLEKYIKDNK